MPGKTKANKAWVLISVNDTTGEKDQRVISDNRLESWLDKLEDKGFRTKSVLPISR